MFEICIVPWLVSDYFFPWNFYINLAQTYLQLPLWQWGIGNVYLLVLSSWKVNIAKTPIAENPIAENPIAVMGL